MRSQPAVLFCCNPDRSVTGIFPLLLNRLIRLIDREQEQNRNRTFFFFFLFSPLRGYQEYNYLKNRVKNEKKQSAKKGIETKEMK